MWAKNMLKCVWKQIEIFYRLFKKFLSKNISLISYISKVTSKRQQSKNFWLPKHFYVYLLEEFPFSSYSRKKRSKGTTLAYSVFLVGNSFPWLSLLFKQKFYPHHPPLWDAKLGQWIASKLCKVQMRIQLSYGMCTCLMEFWLSVILDITWQN